MSKKNDPTRKVCKKAGLTLVYTLLYLEWIESDAIYSHITF